MINLNTFQTIILKFYILPILIVGFIFSYNTTYTISKFFVDDSITINKSTKEIKEIQRRNILLNGVELKKWTTLTQNQKDYFLNNKKEELENKLYNIEYRDGISDLVEELNSIKNQELNNGIKMGKMREYFKKGTWEYERKQYLKNKIKKRKWRTSS